MRRLAVPLCLLAALACASAAEAAIRRMFVTSVAGSGDLSTWPDAAGQTGLAAADAMCQARATAAGLTNPTMFRAWLSTSTTDASCRIHGFGGKKADNCNRPTLPVGAGPWLRPGTPFALPFAAAVPGLLAPARQVYFPPRLDVNGATVHGKAWTASSSQGVLAGATCGNWTDGFPGTTGDSGVTDAPGDGPHCDAARPLYCLQDLPLVFADGFESGSTLAWLLP